MPTAELPQWVVSKVLAAVGPLVASQSDPTVESRPAVRCEVPMEAPLLVASPLDPMVESRPAVRCEVPMEAPLLVASLRDRPGRPPGSRVFPPPVDTPAPSRCAVITTTGACTAGLGTPIIPAPGSRQAGPPAQHGVRPLGIRSAFG